MVSPSENRVLEIAQHVEVGRLGGLACLNLEGLWTRYDDPESVFEEIATEVRAR